MPALAHHDQENFVHSLQTAAAGKPLNAGLKPASRAPKTPFKLALGDENASAFAQTKGKSKGGAGKQDAFVTPAGPRTRAPLGVKTTNAKARAFQTPAPLSASAKTHKASPRLRRPKVRVQPDVQHADDDDDIPEVEYMPPRAVPLPDDMGDFLPRDWTIPKLENGGVWEAYHNPLEDDGRTKLQRRFEEKLERDTKKRDEELERRLDEQMAREEAETARHFGVERSPLSAPRADDAKKRATGPSTLKAKAAAAALSEPRRPAFAAPTAATKSRFPSKTVSSKKPIVNPSAARHAAAAASKSTIGYAQGRENAASRPPARKPLSNVTKPAPFSVTTASRPPTASSTHNRNVSTSSTNMKPLRPFSRSSSTSTNATLVAPGQEASTHRTAEELERELQLILLRDDDEEDVDAWAHSFSSQLGGGDPFDEDLDDFQLPMPGDL